MAKHDMHFLNARRFVRRRINCNIRYAHRPAFTTCHCDGVHVLSFGFFQCQNNIFAVSAGGKPDYYISFSSMRAYLPGKDFVKPIIITYGCQG